MNRWKHTWVVVCFLCLVSSPLFAEPPAGPSLAEDSQLSHLRKRIDSAIALTGRRYLSPERHTPWQIAHGMIAFGQEFRLRRTSDKKYVNAVDYFCNQATAGGNRIFQPSSFGLEALSGGGLEGHPDQFLAIFAQSDLTSDHPIRVGNQDYAVADLVEHAKMNYYVGKEASWTLISLATYLPLDVTWQNSAGRQFGIEDLVRAEVSAEPTTAACGGTHNLFALAYALKRAQSVRQNLTGVWKEAAGKLARYQQRTRALQNEDGSFSSNYLEGPGSAIDETEQIETTGHALEWLALSLSDDELRQPWVTDSVQSLVDVFERTKRKPLDCGPLYHAAHALILYRDRLASLDRALVQVPDASKGGSSKVESPVGSADPAAP